MKDLIQCTTMINRETRKTLVDFSKSPYVIQILSEDESNSSAQQVSAYDSSKLTSTYIDCPSSSDLDLTPILKNQLEVKFPYNHDCLIFDWRQFESKALVLAEDKNRLDPFSSSLLAQGIDLCLLNAEGVAKAFVEFEKVRDAILLWYHDTCIEIIEIQDSKLSHLKNLQLTYGDLNQAKQCEHLVEDLKSMISLLESDPSTPIYGITDRRQQNDLFQNLSGSPLNIQTPQFKGSKQVGLSEEDFMKHLPAIGISLLLHHGEAHFDLFKNLHDDSKTTQNEQPKLFSLFASIVICLGLVFVNLYLNYQNDLKKLNSLQFEPELNQAIQNFQSTQNLKQKIIGERPDLLHLMDILSPKEIKGITLDQLYFKKGQTAKIVGRTKNDMHFKYIEALQKQKDLSQVKLVTPIYDKTKRETTFTVTFEYQKWNRKPSLNPFAQYGN